MTLESSSPELPVKKRPFLHYSNVLFLLVIGVVAVGPSFINGAFGVNLYVAPVAAPNVGVGRGDLLTSRAVRFDNVHVGDTLIISESITRDTALQHVTSVKISTKRHSADISLMSPSGGTTTVTGLPLSAETIRATHVTTGLGPLIIILVSSNLKIGILFFMLVINLLSIVSMRVHTKKAIFGWIISRKIS